jgi:hypothetical protein
MGTSLELLPFEEWLGHIKRLHVEGRSLPMVALLEYAFSMDKEAIDEQRRNSRFARMPIDCTQTDAELERAGIVTPALDRDLLQLCLESMFVRDPDLHSVTARINCVRWPTRGGV